MTDTRSPTRITRRGDLTREQILNTARQLFSTHGYHSTSLYDLFEQAGITKGAFFHHWKSKEELALNIFQEVAQTFEEEIFSASKGTHRAHQKIKTILCRISEISLSNKRCCIRIFALWCTELQADEESLGPVVHALRARWSVLWNDLIRQAQLENDLRKDISAENLSFLVSSAIFGVQLLNGNGNHNINSTKIATETLVTALLS